MTGHCAWCCGKFGLVRYRRAFKTFCSPKCVEDHRAWIRSQSSKRGSWFDCLWSASLNMAPGIDREGMPREAALSCEPDTGHS
jgi:hypothetical protein